MARAVFLDRDGVINQKMPEGKYVTCPEEFVIIDGALEAIKALKDEGFLVFIITNQRGVALGEMTMERVNAIHKVLKDKLMEIGTDIDGIYTCPHDKDSCDCRKPKPGLIMQAKNDFPEIDLEKSIVIGDSITDIEAGKAAGCGDLIMVDRCKRSLLYVVVNLVIRN